MLIAIRVGVVVFIILALYLDRNALGYLLVEVNVLPPIIRGNNPR
jgi:hypothetical protein